MLTAKIITEIREKHSEFSGYQNSCNKFVSSRSWQAMKLPMILLWQAVVLEVGVQGLHVHPKKFWFAENLGKSVENPGKNVAQHCLTSENGAQSLHKNTWRPFFEVTLNIGLHDLCGRKFVGKSCTITFRASLGKFGKILRTPKVCLVLRLWRKGNSVPLPLFWKGRGEMLSPCLHSPASLCILFYTHSLYSLL